MKPSRLSLSLAVLILLPISALALDSNIFEKDGGKVTSFTAKVRVVRDISDDVEVFFDSDKAKGAYTLPHGLSGYAAALAQLEASKKPGGPAVTVSADADKRITEVKGSANRPAATKDDILKASEAVFKK